MKGVVAGVPGAGEGVWPVRGLGTLARERADDREALGEHGHLGMGLRSEVRSSTPIRDVEPPVAHAGLSGRAEHRLVDVALECASQSLEVARSDETLPFGKDPAHGLPVVREVLGERLMDDLGGRALFEPGDEAERLRTSSEYRTTLIA